MKFSVAKAKKGKGKQQKVVAADGVECRSVDPIICAAKLDEQAALFVITMMANSKVAMEVATPMNLLTCLWRRLEASGL